MHEFGYTSREYDEDMWINDLKTIHILEPIRREKEAQSQASILNSGISKKISPNEGALKHGKGRGKSSKFS